MVQALADLGQAAIARAIAAVTLVHVGGALLVTLAVGLVLRQVRRRRMPRLERTRRTAFTRPPPSLAQLLDALARRGAVRPASEPLERFADRLDAPALHGAADLLRRWAAHRYGGIGSEEALSREMARCAEELRR
jgi:hypothetical protein